MKGKKTRPQKITLLDYLNLSYRLQQAPSLHIGYATPYHSFAFDANNVISEIDPRLSCQAPRAVSSTIIVKGVITLLIFHMKYQTIQ